MQLKVYYGSCPPNWDDNLGNAAHEAGFCQSVCWANIICKVDNAKAIYIQVFDNNDIILSLLFFHKIPWDRGKHKIKKGIYELLSGTNKGWLTMMDGPVFYTYDRVQTLESLNLILNWIEDYVIKNGLYKVESHGFSHQSMWAIDSDIKSIFNRFGYCSNTRATYLVDLTLDEKEIWNNLKNSAKKSIRKAKKLGVNVFKINSLEEYRKKFYLPYVEMEKAFGRKTNPWQAEEVQWNEGHEIFYHYYIVQTNVGEIIGTLGMYIFNRTATEIASSMSKKAFTEKLPAQDILHWEMILEAKRLGCNTFNLAGINPNPTNSKEVGIRQFKEKWGGKYVEFFTYEKLSSSWSIVAADKIKKIVRKYLLK